MYGNVSVSEAFEGSVLFTSFSPYWVSQDLGPTSNSPYYLTFPTFSSPLRDSQTWKIFWLITVLELLLVSSLLPIYRQWLLFTASTVLKINVYTNQIMYGTISVTLLQFCYSFVWNKEYIYLSCILCTSAIRECVKRSTLVGLTSPKSRWWFCNLSRSFPTFQSSHLHTSELQNWDIFHICLTLHFLLM